MTRWQRDVLLVLRNDMRALWPFSSLYVAVLIYGVLQARGVVDVGASSGVGIFLLYGSAMLCSTLLIHRHTPASPSAHWSGLPHERSAVWAAKWIVLAMLLVCGVTALLISVNGQPDPNGMIRPFTYARAASLSAAIAAAALVASIKRELRTVLLILLTLPLISVACVLLAFLLLMDEVTHALFHPFVVLFATMLAALTSWWLYHQRSVSRTIVIRVVTGSALLFASVIVSRQPSIVYLSEDPSLVLLRESATADRLAKVTVFAEYDPRWNDSLNAGYTTLRLNMEGAPENLRADWIFTSHTAETEALKDISKTVVTSGGPGRTRFSSTLYTPSLPLAPDTRWLGGLRTDGTSVSARRAAFPDFWSVQAGELKNPERGKNPVDGVVRFSQPAIVARLQIENGTFNSALNQQWRIVEHGGSELLCAKMSSRCNESYPTGTLVNLQLRSELMVDNSSLAFAWVNASRNEAVELSTATMATKYQNPDLMFLPSATLMIEWLLVPRYEGTNSAQLDDAWLRDAELVIVRWEPVGALSVPITAMGAD